jgi:hypothetical protein
MALAARYLGHDVKAVITNEHLKEHSFLKDISWMSVQTVPEVDIYIAKSDTYYRARS